MQHPPRSPMAIQPDHMLGLLAGFRNLDVNRDGTIGLPKFQFVLESVMPTLSRSDVHRLIEYSGACSVCYVQFVEWLCGSNHLEGLGAWPSGSRPATASRPKTAPAMHGAQQGPLFPEVPQWPGQTYSAILKDLGGEKAMMRFAEQSRNIADVIKKHICGEEGDAIYHSLGFWLDLLLQAADPEAEGEAGGDNCCASSRNRERENSDVGDDPDEFRDSVERRQTQRQTVCMDSLARRYGGLSVPEDEDTGSDCDTETQQVPPDFLRPRGLGVSAEAYGAWNQRKPFVPPLFDKPADQRRAIAGGLKSVEFCEGLSKEELDALVSAVKVEAVQPGECVMKTGDPGDALFVVLLGAIDIFQEDVESSDLEATFIGTLTKGRVFGERALLASFPRVVTAYGKEGGITQLGRLDREVFTNFTVVREQQMRERRQELLRSIKLLEMMNDEQIAKLAEALALQVYEEGDTIIHQGEKGESLFIIQSGEAVAIIETGQFESDIQEHRRYHEGALFGERSFLQGAERGATIIACTRVEAWIQPQEVQALVGIVGSTAGGPVHD